MFFNKGTSVEDALTHTVDFKFQEPFQITRVTSLMKSTSGMSHVCGTQSGKAFSSQKTANGPWCYRNRSHQGNAHVSMVRRDLCHLVNGLQTSSLLWKVFDNNQDYCHILCAEKQDVSKVIEHQSENWICCPDILNVVVNVVLWYATTKIAERKSTPPRGLKL